MQDFTDRVAVVTGAAKGIGHALAARCVAEGMHVIMADIDAAALDAAAAQLRRQGSAPITTAATDVADPDSVQELARLAKESDREIALLFNNAGVATAGDLGQLWRSASADWHQIIDVNLWGVINGCMSFLPALMNQTNPSRIVNTASISGVISAPAIAIYSMTKHAVVSLSDSLDQQLQDEGSMVGVSAVCPGFVRTHLVDEWTRDRETSEKMIQNHDWLEGRISEGSDPEDIAERIFDGIRQDRRYIFTHSGFREALVERHERILADFDAVIPKDPRLSDDPLSSQDEDR
jgi:NAD(P)-dependent dehydrogenase (short-subunit alcohol dehydrogenase family)